MRLSRTVTLAGLWALFLAIECTAQISLKLGSHSLESLDFGREWLTVAIESPWVELGIVCYLLAFVFWMLILDKMELSLAFPLSGMVYVVVMASSAFGLHEALTPLHMLGVGLIVIGVCVMGQD
jgi:multidrug transporter EmrE-like cation transporter